MKKSAEVFTNDQQRPRLSLTISGDVEKFVTIKPRQVNLRGTEGDSIKGSVTIVPEKKYPFKIISSRAKNGKLIKFDVKEKQGPDGIQYVLNVENLKTDAGRYFDIITLKTDSKFKSELNVRVYGNLRERKKKAGN